MGHLLAKLFTHTKYMHNIDRIYFTGRAGQVKLNPVKIVNLSSLLTNKLSDQSEPLTKVSSDRQCIREPSFTLRIK